MSFHFLPLHPFTLPPQPLEQLPRCGPAAGEPEQHLLVHRPASTFQFEGELAALRDAIPESVRRRVLVHDRSVSSDQRLLESVRGVGRRRRQSVLADPAPQHDHFAILRPGLLHDVGALARLLEPEPPETDQGLDRPNQDRRPEQRPLQGARRGPGTVSLYQISD